jgi:hypothetical protein
MTDILYRTDLFGPVKIVGRDITGRVLIETMERREKHPEWPYVIEPGHREWVSQFAVGEALSRPERPEDKS